MGRSTAGAILSSALGGRAPILDGNVKRVLARYHGVEGWPGRSAVAARLWTLAEGHTPTERVADYTQAIMDLGATLCTRSNPGCERCPVAKDCAARAAGRQADYPGRRPKKARPTRSTVFVLACTPAGELFLERRPQSGIWGGLWCFPEVDDPEAAAAYCVDRLAVAPTEARELPGLRHSFSHFHLEIRPLLLRLERAPAAAADGDAPRAWPVGTYPEVGLAAPVSRIWDSAAVIISGERPRSDAQDRNDSSETHHQESLAL